nr:unnamed protein product [Haemonchus contortus]
MMGLAVDLAYGTSQNSGYCDPFSQLYDFTVNFVTRSAMARYFSFPLLLMALLLISTVIPSTSSEKTSVDKKKPSVKKVKLLKPKGASAKTGLPRVKRWSFPVPGRG